METASLTVPVQSAGQGQPSASVYECGMAGTPWVHAVHQTLNGVRPLCQSGMSVIRIGGRFDPFDAQSCKDCADRTILGG